MALISFDGLSRFRQVGMEVVNLFDLRCYAGCVVDEPFGDLSRRSYLTVNAAIRPAEIVKRPALYAVLQLLLVLAPPRKWAFVRNSRRKEEVRRIAAGHGSENVGDKLAVRESVLL